MPSDAPHLFHAVAFVENLPLKELAQAYPEAQRASHELSFPVKPGPDETGEQGAAFVYPFGVIVFRDVPAARRAAELTRLRAARTVLTDAFVTEDLTVREDAGRKPHIAEGVLVVDRLTPQRASIVALTIAQSAAMEYYERIVDEMSQRTDRIVGELEAKGTVSLRTRPLHRFIGTATATRNEVVNVLHVLDKPDEAWHDPDMDRIYDELKAEFDLVDRFHSLEAKLRSMQESLGLVLDVARDRRLVLLETAVVLLILFEIVLAVARVH